MSLFPFVKSFAGAKSDQVGQKIVESLVKADPKGATQAQLRVLSNNLDDLGLQITQAQQSVQHETDIIAEMKSVQAQRIKTAEILQGKIDAETDEAKKASLTDSMNTVLAKAEEIQPDIDSHTQDAASAKEFLSTLQAEYAKAAERIKTAKHDMENAARDMQRADLQAKQAEDRKIQAERAAGLNNSIDTLDVAQKAMKDIAAKKLAEAQAANMKTQALKPTSSETDDPNIAAAMKEASGAPTSPVSAAERLAALKAKG